MSKSQDRAIYADVDFDTTGRITKNIAAQSAADPVLHHIVSKILNGQPVSVEERHYYDIMAPDVVHPETDCGEPPSPAESPGPVFK